MTAVIGPYTHLYIPPTSEDPRTLLLLHGTGGDENDLIPLGRMLAPGTGLLSPRGTVLENGAPRFFRRLAEGVFDLDDLRARTEALASFVRTAAERYAFDLGRVIAVGFSNGANIAGSTLLSHPGLLRAAVLFRPMVPFEPPTPVELVGTDVYIGAGETDPLVPASSTERLAELLRASGARVTVEWQRSGHALTNGDVAAARTWITTLR